MDRRQFVGALAGGVLATSRIARAQQAPKLPLIATLSAGSEAPAELRRFDAFLARTFLARMKDLGYEDGRNLRIEAHSSGGDPQRLADLASEIVRRNPDVILTTSTPATYAAKLATSTIPIVMTGTLDAQAAGLVTSLSRPGGNIARAWFRYPEIMEILGPCQVVNAAQGRGVPPMLQCGIAQARAGASTGRRNPAQRR